MKSGTQSSRLTLVDRNGQEIAGHPDGEETSVEYVAPIDSTSDKRTGRKEDQTRRTKLITFVAVSAGCAAAAVITGSYALWLSRQRIANEALTSVHDLLETCRVRVSQMEHDLSHLNPNISSQSRSVG